MKTLKKLIIIFTSMFMLAALLSCDDGGCVESQAGEVSPKSEWHIIHLSDVSLGCEYKIELAENLKTEYNSLNINNISGVLPNKYKFFYTSEDIKKMTDAGYDCHYGFAMTSAELKESFQYSNSDDLYLNDVFKTPEKDVKIYYGIYKLSDDIKEIQYWATMPDNEGKQTKVISFTIQQYELKQMKTLALEWHNINQMASAVHDFWMAQGVIGQDKIQVLL